MSDENTAEKEVTAPAPVSPATTLVAVVASPEFKLVPTTAPSASDEEKDDGEEGEGENEHEVEALAPKKKKVAKNKAKPSKKTAKKSAKKSAKKAAKKSAKKAKPGPKPGAKVKESKSAEGRFANKKDVIIAALIDGGLEDLVRKNKKKKIGLRVLKQAAQELEAKGRTQAASKIASLVEEWYPNKGRRGRASPSEGDTRVYRVQKLNDAKLLWVRIPVGSIGAKAKDRVSVKFEAKRLVITLDK